MKPETLPERVRALFDETAFEAALAQQSSLLPVVKAAVARINDGLQMLYGEGVDVDHIVHGRAFLTDALLRQLYRHFFGNLQQPLALLAVGGYGRGELHPHSDIDLMLLLDEAEDPQTREQIEQFLMLLWDGKLEIGHSVRTLDECVSEAEKDITVITNIMEARQLAGDHTLFEKMKAATAADRMWNSRRFFQAKLEEQVQRNGKFNDTAYNLEPNIKESHGGLRDIQMIGWVAKRHFNTGSLAALVEKRFLQQDEYQALCEGQRLLWQIRCSLHYMAGRREDRLLFDYQRDLANAMGYQDDPDQPGNQVIEQMMQKYYRTVKDLQQLNEMLLQYFREAILFADETDEPQVINDDFQVNHGYLETRHRETFAEHPHALLELFHLLQEHTEIQGVRASTIREIKKHLPLIDDRFRGSATARKCFMRIINHPRGLTHELRRMNRYGVLSAYIPAFDSIVGRMQYDLFHAYTVDQHTLFVIRNMRRLSVPEFCHEFPLASGVFQHLPKPALLYLAGLFHDIAKGRGGDHSELGAVDAYDFCRHHDLPEEDAQLVSWLVANHLIMSMTAQNRDLSDPDVIAEFTRKVDTLQKLDYLYLLTMSDIRATNPEQWNSWKDKLLTELYNKAASLINLGTKKRKSRLENITETQTDALRQLEQQGILPQTVQAIWKNLSNGYFQDHTPGQIVWHTALIANRDTPSDEPLIATRIDQDTHSIELMVYMPSQDRIFYNIVSLIANSGMDIVNAQIVNCRNRYALETFRLIPDQIADSELERAAADIQQRIRQRFDTQSTQHPEISLTPLRINKHFDSPTVITYKDKDDITRVKIETKNQSGILAVISKLFFENRIQLLSAHVHTAGEKVMDYFYVTDSHSKPLDDTLKATLARQLKEQL